MAKVESSLLVRRMPWHSNMTEKNHLGKALIIKPHAIEKHMRRLFSSVMYSENSMYTILDKEGAIETIDKDTWEWPMKGANTKPCVIIENVVPAAITQPGRMRQEFRMKFDDNSYKAGDVIYPGTADKSLQVRIQRFVMRHGLGSIYEVIGMSDDPSFFIPVKYLTPGTKWVKLFSQYEEAAEQSGSTTYSLPETYRSRMSRYRKEYSVTGDAAQEVLSIAIPDENGTYHNSWIKYAEVEYWAQWYREKERGAWLSRSTNTVLGANGRPIFSGPGFDELMEDSHKLPFSVFSAVLVEEFLMDIFYSRIKPGKQRRIKAFTGEYGMLIFSRAMNDLLQQRGWTIVGQNFNPVNKAASDVHQNAYSYGYQFILYRMHNGAELELIHNPIQDDREINIEIDELTGYPVESQAFYIMNFSQEYAGNIKIFQKSNAMKLGYVSGMQNPYGPNNGSMMSHSGDYYEMHVQDQCGSHIEDTSNTGKMFLKRA